MQSMADDRNSRRQRRSVICMGLRIVGACCPRKELARDGSAPLRSLDAVRENTPPRSAARGAAVPGGRDGADVSGRTPFARAEPRERKFLIHGEYPGSGPRRRNLGEEDRFELPHLPRQLLHRRRGPVCSVQKHGETIPGHGTCGESVDVEKSRTSHRSIAR